MVVLFLEKIPIKTWIPLFLKNWIFRAMIRIVRKYSILVELTFRVYTYVDFVNLAMNGSPYQIFDSRGVKYFFRESLFCKFAVVYKSLV